MSKVHNEIIMIGAGYVIYLHNKHECSASVSIITSFVSNAFSATTTLLECSFNNGICESLIPSQNGSCWKIASDTTGLCY